MVEDLSALSSEVLTTALKPTAGLLKRYENAKEAYETALAAYNAAKGTSEENKAFQLMRVGYYKKCTDEKGGLVLSEIVSLKDNFNK